MRIRSRIVSGVKLDMTPMIDIVFQLLAFFAMTLQIASQEGDLTLQPPAGLGAANSPREFVPPLWVVLRSDEHGGLRTLQLNGRTLSGVDQLHQEIKSLVGHDVALAAATEARLDCDRDLAYEHTIAAVTALSGTRLKSGELQPLVGRVRFVERQ